MHGDLGPLATYVCVHDPVDRASLLEMVFRLFHLILLYSFKEELDGWRLWAEIAAAIHAYVSRALDNSLTQDIFQAFLLYVYKTLRLPGHYVLSTPDSLVTKKYRILITIMKCLTKKNPEMSDHFWGCMDILS